MDLYTAGLLIGPILAVWITWRVLKRKYARQFPPPPRVVEIRDIRDTF